MAAATRAEESAAQFGPQLAFAWTAEERSVADAAMAAAPLPADMKLRIDSIRAKLRHDGAPLMFTLPEGIALGFALSRYNTPEQQVADPRGLQITTDLMRQIQGRMTK